MPFAALVTANTALPYSFLGCVKPCQSCYAEVLNHANYYLHLNSPIGKLTFCIVTLCPVGSVSAVNLTNFFKSLEMVI